MFLGALNMQHISMFKNDLGTKKKCRFILLHAYRCVTALIPAFSCFFFSHSSFRLSVSAVFQFLERGCFLLDLSQYIQVPRTLFLRFWNTFTVQVYNSFIHNLSPIMSLWAAIQAPGNLLRWNKRTKKKSTHREIWSTTGRCSVLFFASHKGLLRLSTRWCSRST